MRIAFTANGGYSHLVPLVLPIASLAQRAGHEVTVVTGPEQAPTVEVAGLSPLVLTTTPALHHARADPEVAAELADVAPTMQPGVTTGVTPELFARGFISVMGGRTAPELVDTLADWKPDVVLSESTEFGGYLAAQRLGIPQGVIDMAPMAPYTCEPVLTELNQQRSRLNLPDIDDPLHPMRGFRASMIPVLFHPEHLRLSTDRHYRPPEAASEELDPAIVELVTDRPLALASLGSNAVHLYGDDPSPLDTIIETLGDLPVTAVVALGHGRDPAGWTGARPDNVHLTSFVQQRTLLAATDIFLTHGGFNGTREALTQGVPMVVTPIGAEQPANAARIEELGAGLRINLEDLTSDTLRPAVERVLNDPSFRARARGLQRETLGLPPAERLLDDLVGYIS